MLISKILICLSDDMLPKKVWIKKPFVKVKVPVFSFSHFNIFGEHSVSKRSCPAKTKVGRNWYQSTGIALVLGRWTLFFNFKGTPCCISHKTFCRHLSTIYWLCGKELVKRWKWCVALTNLDKHGISANRSGAIWCTALHGIFLAWFNFTNWL
jgi:hypothetical protein